ncbi:DUF2207 domain-containing protein [Clostridium aminobutyricum]|uniref:DUF2207 domain-containing protein n=1 Tax=Clostridium aminobutyricum TaxID=33953 RepID=A0A939D901_CLOAM|nr:DUF2207 domain-containing protein [Clostridium aminobutyricum]MBN7772923.1 DUF2207 domain-containing protein [Clostridium aminobutyricum]
MKKRWKRFTAIGFIAVLFIGLSMPLFAEPVYGSGGFATNEYDTNLTVEENNTIYVTETIKVNFSEERHGIYRYIPYKGKTKVQMNDKVVEINQKMKIDQVDIKLNGVSCDYSTSRENDNLVLKIGSESKTVYGPQEYTISYRCRLYDDGIQDFDVLYWDLIPTGWESPIGKSAMSIQMPKSFNAANAEFTSGIYGSISSDKMSWFVSDGMTLTAQVQDLALGEGVTLILELPNDYFQGEITNDWAFLIMFIFMIVPPIVIAGLWFIFGRDPQIVKTVEFYPPAGMTPAEVGYIVDGVVDKKDIISMIIYFADKGYLRIEEQGADQFTLYKEKEFPADAKIFEQTLFEGIFKNREQVNLQELGEDFYANYKASITQLQGYYNKDRDKRVYTLGSTLARVFSFLFMLVPIIGGYVFGAIGTMKDEFILVGVVITNIVFLGAIMLIIAYDRKDAMKASSRRILVVSGLIATGIGFFSEFYGMWKAAGLLPAVIMTASTLLSVVFTIFMKKRTNHSAKLMGKLLGFKEFIDVAELDRIKRLVEQNPSYFYNVLPYAYVFGLSDKWAKKFEQINIEPPTWYTGSVTGNMFNTWIFMSMMNNYTRTFSDHIVIPSSEGSGSGMGGFSGGGGFTGGGFGGGGGGSW